VRKTICIMILMIGFLGIHLPVKVHGLNNKEGEPKIDKGHQSIPEATFREIFRDYVCKRLGKEKFDIIVSRFSIIGNNPVPEGKLGFQVFQKDERRLAGYVRLSAVINVNGIVRNTVKLNGWIDIFGPVVCTGRGFKKGEIIKEDVLCLERRNTSRMSEDVLTDMNEAVGKRAKHTIKEEACLKGWMLERPPVLSRGDMVMILAESGSLKITVPGRALEKAQIGELIKVENIMSKKEIYARVIDNSTVMVDF